MFLGDTDTGRHDARVLVPIGVAVYVLGLDPKRVGEMVECGRLRWVWDVSATHGRPVRRELRFWLGELLAGERHANAEVEHVIECVVGHPMERTLYCRTVCRILNVARPHLKRLVDTGELPVARVSALQAIARADLCGFLSRRLVH